jgi:hypothetical protein
MSGETYEQRRETLRRLHHLIFKDDLADDGVNSDVDRYEDLVVWLEQFDALYDETVSDAFVAVTREITLDKILDLFKGLWEDFAFDEVIAAAGMSNGSDGA